VLEGFWVTETVAAPEPTRRHKNPGSRGDPKRLPPFFLAGGDLHKQQNRNNQLILIFFFCADPFSDHVALLCSGLVVLSFFFKRQIWRLRKECWRLELRVQLYVGEELLREAEDEQILGVQRGSLSRAFVVSARWGWLMVG